LVSLAVLFLQFGGGLAMFQAVAYTIEWLSVGVVIGRVYRA
jgi:hypothetical protein